MAEEEKPTESPAVKTLDNLYDRLSSYLSERVGNFVAFIFFTMTIGAIIGSYAVTHHPNLAFYVIMGPAVLGLAAYYNRDIATFLFVILLGSLLFL